MKYAGLMPNDVVNGEGVCVSLWTQGCPHHCDECFNPETWDFAGGTLVPDNLDQQVLAAISANNIQRNFSILGGEPLCNPNIQFTEHYCSLVREKYPFIKIFIWTGYEFSDIKNKAQNDSLVSSILEKSDVVISGPFIKEKKDLTLKLRGSSNQQIWRKINNKWVEIY